MTWSFDSKLGSKKDKVRSLVGDVTQTSQLVTDEEIDAWLTEANNNVREAAAHVAEGLASRFARRSNVQIDGFKVDNARKVTLYENMAARLRSSPDSDVGGGLGAPFVGGVSVGEMASVEADIDRVQPLMSNEVWEDDRG